MGIKGAEDVAYGTWKDERRINEGVWVSFYDEWPQVTFPSGEEKISLGSIGDDGYIYHSYRDIKAKNPRKRLPIKKVK